MTETIFGKNLFDVYFDFLVWPVSHLLTWGGRVYDLYYQGAIQMIWLHFLGSCHVVYPSIWSVVLTELTSEWTGCRRKLS